MRNKTQLEIAHSHYSQLELHLDLIPLNHKLDNHNDIYNSIIDKLTELEELILEQNANRE